jgi:tRNA(Arg) A34 adenosine deaminase TadA
MKLDLYVARTEMKMSKPCEYCCHLLKHFGIHRVIYSNGIGNGYTIEKVSDIESKHRSHSDRTYCRPLGNIDENIKK